MLMYRRRASASVPSVHSKTIAALLTTAIWCLLEAVRQNGLDCHMPVAQQQHASHMPVMDFDSLTKWLLKSGILSSRDFW